VEDLSFLILNITDSALIEQINQFSRDNISDDDLSDNGRETEYHMTLLSNIKSDSEEAFKILGDKAINVELGKISKFENDEDVIKIEVKKSKELIKLYNELVKNVDNEVEYEFNPHVTIAYVKKGACEELVSDDTFDGIKVKFNLVKFSPENENEVIYRKLSMIEPDKKQTIDELNSKYDNFLSGIENNPNTVVLDVNEVRKFPYGEKNKCETNVYKFIKNKLSEGIDDYYPVSGYFINKNNFPIEHWWVYNSSFDEYLDVTPSETDEQYIKSYVGIINYNINDDIKKAQSIWDIDFFKGGNFNKTAKVFHRDIGFPVEYQDKLKWFVADLNGMPTTFTKHYMDNEERTPQVDNFLKYLQIKSANVFEFTTDEFGKILKVACRVPYYNGKDIIFSVSAEKRIISFWFNDSGDTHKTLDKSKYDYAMKKSRTVRYGGWISPDGEYNEVSYQGHELWASRYFRKLKLDDEANYDSSTALMNRGWIRVLFNNDNVLSFDIYDLSRCRIIDNFILDNYIDIGMMYIDCHNNEKSYSITRKEYEESDFNLKEAIQHSRDIRGMKKKAYNDDSYWKQNGKWQMLTTDKYKFIIMPSYSAGSRKVQSWSVQIKDLTDLVKGTQDGFKTINEAKRWVDEYNTMNKQSNKTTKLQLSSYTDLVSALKLLKSLKWHKYKYEVEGNSLVFSNTEHLQDVKQLLDSYNIGNLVKTSKTKYIDELNELFGDELDSQFLI